MKSPFLRPVLSLAGLLAVFSSSAVDANQDWPLWRGPSLAGVAPGAQPPATWSDTRNIRWKTKIPGSGFSTPIVWQDRIFLLTAIVTDEERAAPVADPVGTAAGRNAGRRGGGGGGFRGGGPTPTKVHEFVVLALERTTGRFVWQQVARREVPHEGHHASHGFASASPVTDGARLWVSFGSRGLYCFDLAGNLQWERDLGDMRTRGGFGEGASPALAGDVLLVPWDHEDGSFIVALDKSTGREVWRKSRDERSSWSTPVIVEVGGRLQAVLAATNRTRAYDVATGDVVWEAGGLTPNVIPTPVVGHGMIYVMSGFQGNAVQAIKLTAKGDVTDTDQVAWSRRRSAPYVPSPVLSGDRLFLSKSNDAYLSCLNALTGEVHYEDQPLPGVRGIYASPLAANGYLYVVGREGTTLVLKDQPKFEIVATNTLSEKIDASPVMLGRELYLRGHEHLYCIADG